MNLLYYLKQQPKARERSNKNRAIGNLIIEKYHLSIDKGTMADLVAEALTMDRQWRKILEENPDLRGSDYSEGKILAQEKMLELGYRPGYHQDIRQGSML